MNDFYNLLGVAKDASPEAIKQAFRQQAKQSHPDANPHLQGAAREAMHRRFVALAQAYETLSDPVQRQAYDRKLGQTRTARPTNPRPQENTTFRGTPGKASRAESATDQAQWEDLLGDAEALLRQFGLSTKQPWEQLLERLLQWAVALYNQVVQEPAGQAPPKPKPTAERTASPQWANLDAQARQRQQTQAVEQELAKLKAQRNKQT